MVHLCRVTDCLARTLHGLCWMALQPQIPGEDPAGQVFSFKAEIAGGGTLRPRPTLQRRLKLYTGAAKIPTEVQRITQNGTSGRESGRVPHGCCDSRTAPCVVERSFELPGA